MDEEPFKVVNEKDNLLPPNERPNISSSYDPRPNNTNNKFRKFCSAQNSPVSKRKQNKSISKYEAFSSRDDYDIKSDFFANKSHEKRGICDEELTEQVLENIKKKNNADSCQSLNYDANENQLHQDEIERLYFKQSFSSQEMQRWFVCLLIGMATGVTAVIVNLAIELIGNFKTIVIAPMIEQCVRESCMYKPMILLLLFNTSLILVAALLTVYVSPVAAGSGIPQIKLFLNGVKVPGVMRAWAFITKVFGVIATVCGGLASGKEGPMVHAGAVLAAGISQGRSLAFKINTSFFEFFRNDREKRDFVCAGAAAGVSAAFGAPVGGVLFSLEEAASFWNLPVTLRTFVASTVSSYTLNVLMSIYKGTSGDLANPGLLNFGAFKGSYEGFELFIFIFMACIGSMFGVLFVAINKQITLFRHKHIRKKRDDVIEVVIVNLVCGCVAFLSMFIAAECRPLGIDPDAYLQFYCHDGQYNVMATLFFSTPEKALRSVFHDPQGAYGPTTISYFAIVYFCMAVWTYGLKVPTGLFVPTLLTGACWGRLVGIGLNHFFPDQEWTKDLSKYALMGAAAQLGGTVRMTISLAVILVEATGSITYSLPLMAVLLVAKWLGDLMNAGIYDTHIHIMNIPLLEVDSKPQCKIIQCRDVMSFPPVCLRKHTKLSEIVEILKSDKLHNCFPIIDNNDKFSGFINPYEVMFLIQKKNFVEKKSEALKLQLKDFIDDYPRFGNLMSTFKIYKDELDLHVDLTTCINPNPYTVFEKSTLSKVYLLFRSLGLRHLCVLDNNCRPVGVITRSELWKYGKVHHQFD